MKHASTLSILLAALLFAPLAALPADTPVNSGKLLTGRGLVMNHLLEAESEANC